MANTHGWENGGCALRTIGYCLCVCLVVVDKLFDLKVPALHSLLSHALPTHRCVQHGTFVSMLTSLCEACGSLLLNQTCVSLLYNSAPHHG